MTMDATLAEKRCEPCTSGTPPLKGEALGRLLERLGGGWSAVGEHHLEKTFRFRNFRDALAFVNRIGETAEEQGHHPDLALAWGKVTVALRTHKIEGLSENDFVLAARIDRLPGATPPPPAPRPGA